MRTRVYYIRVSGSIYINLFFLRKMTANTMPYLHQICPSLRKDIGNRWVDFREISYGEYLIHSVKQIQVWLQRNKIKSLLLRDILTL